MAPFHIARGMPRPPRDCPYAAGTLSLAGNADTVGGVGAGVGVGCGSPDGPVVGPPPPAPGSAADPPPDRVGESPPPGVPPGRWERVGDRTAASGGADVRGPAAELGAAESGTGVEAG